jgi:hypothetical protein
VESRATSDWIAFGYSALGQPIDRPELWIANRAGTAARKIVDAWASWPAWLAGS